MTKYTLTKYTFGEIQENAFRVVNVSSKARLKNTWIYIWHSSIMEYDLSVRNVITGALQSNILDYTWHPSIDENDSWLHLGKTLFGKIHFGKIYSYQFRSALLKI